MQTLTRNKKGRSPWPEGSPRSPQRRFSPFMLISIGVTLAIVIGTGGFLLVRSYMAAHAATAVNPDCTIIVPANPLSAQGLATPYQLVATDPNNGACDEANAGQAAFVQGAILDPATGQISIYNPLVVTKGSQPAVAPTAPNLPANAVVGLWFGYNGGNLTLQSTHRSLQDGRCVNGLPNSIFGQFAACNAPDFFKAANRAISNGKITVPALGTAKDGLPCPSTHDFSVVDQDQSDNVTTEYLINTKGLLAQMSAANTAALASATLQVNGSDERLVSIALDNALGCQPWTAPDLVDPGQMVTALPLNELQAAYDQSAPAALVPGGDPMTVDGNGNPNLDKLNLYRASVDQPTVRNLNQASTKTYCQILLNVAPSRLVLDAALTRQQPSPDAGAANNLFTFLAQRFNASWTNLNCMALTGQNSPITLTKQGDVTVDAAINVQAPTQVPPTSPATQPTPTTAPVTPTVPQATPTTVPVTPTAPQATPTTAPVTPTVAPTSPPAANAPVDCNVNGQTLAGCNGTTTINGQTCQFAFDQNTNQIVVTCPTKN